ncbi:MAG: DUF2197 domain-containing protein [Bacillota bacterium]
MKVRCMLCGTEQEINKIHKDYQRLAKDPRGIFVCNACSNKARFQALETQKTAKPI